MIKRANLYMLILLVYQLVISAVLAFAIVFFEVFLNASVNIYVLQIVSQLLSFVPPFAVYLVVTRGKIGDVLPMRGLNITNLLFVLCISIAVQPAAMAVSGITSYVFNNNVAVLLEDMMDFPIAIVLAAVAVTPALLEEITFRGVILSNMKHFSIKKAALMSGLFFGLMHMDLQQLPYAFLLGVIFAYLVYYTRSILSSIIGHFIINASQVFLGYTALSETAYEMEQTSLAGDLLGLMPAIVISIPAFIIIFRYFIVYNTKNGAFEQEIRPSQKTFTWEFWATIAVYAAITASLQFFT